MKPALKVLYSPKKTAGEMRRFTRVLQFPVDRLLAGSPLQRLKAVLAK